MHDPGADVAAGEVVCGEEAVDVAAEIFNDDFGDVGREDDVEAFFRDRPSHDVFGVGIEDAVGGEDAGTAARHLIAGCFVASDENGGGAVAKEASGDEVGDGFVVTLPGEGAEFDGKQDGDVVGVGADVVGGARDAGGSGDTAEAEDGVAADVRRERHAIDEARIDGGAGDRRYGDEEDGGELIGAKAGLSSARSRWSAGRGRERSRSRRRWFCRRCRGRDNR